MSRLLQQMSPFVTIDTACAPVLVPCIFALRNAEQKPADVWQPLLQQLNRAMISKQLYGNDQQPAVWQ